MSIQGSTANLAPQALIPLPLGSVLPRGWLAEQLTIQLNGLSGHLDEFWPDIRDSGWIGGPAESWERGPYWLDGVVPLAYLLNDDSLKAKVNEWMDFILAHQKPDGWFGPAKAKGHDSNDPWPQFVLLKALTQYQEATGDPRVMGAMAKCLRKIDKVIEKKPLKEWGRYRWADLVLSIHWLFDRTGEAWLLELSEKVHKQGFDWRGNFVDFRFTSKTTMDKLATFSEEAYGSGDNVGFFATHVVNNAMGIKAPGVWYRQSKDPEDRHSHTQILDMLDKYHGQATGMFSGDEHLAGNMPFQGTELCAVVEAMFSLETLLAVTADPELGDRLEKIAFNALPATFKKDMWAHQYVQQVNQVVCKVAEDRVYSNNGPDANTFGLEPHFGCCTANMHQGWPKFVSHLWMRTSDNGLAAISYAPCHVSTTANGAAVEVDVVTEYPFGDRIRITVKVDKPSYFPLRLRIPRWVKDGALTIAGHEYPLDEPGTFYDVVHAWKDETEIMLRLPMRPALKRRPRNSVVLERGPLVYSLALGENWQLLKGKPPAADWEVFHTTPWNYAIQAEEEYLNRLVEFKERGLRENPFSPEGAPIRAFLKGRRMPEWVLDRNAAGALPESPVHSGERLEELIFIPYGCTNLRVTEFPALRRDCWEEV